MNRRDFIGLAGGVLAAWPLPALAQQPGHTRHIGVLLYLQENDPEARAYGAAFLKELHVLGWTADHNVQIDYRFPGGDADRVRRYAAELVALAPDVILNRGGVGDAQHPHRVRSGHRPGRRRLDLLWPGCGRSVPAGSRLHRSHSEGRKAGQSASAGIHEIPAGMNQKTAKTLGLAIPQSIVLRADEVIQ